MNKPILMSIQPQYVAKILNGEKTIEIRKKFPKDYVGWVYIYCTKGKEMLFKAKLNINNKVVYHLWDKINNEGYRCYDETELNGKVVARFWCDKVARFTNFPSGYETYVSGTFPNIKVMKEEELLKLSCLSKEELRKYIPYDKERTGYAIHISKLEVFDKTKEIGELKKLGYEKLYNQYMDNCLTDSNSYENLSDAYSLTKAPQSWQFIEDTQ